MVLKPIKIEALKKRSQIILLLFLSNLLFVLHAQEVKVSQTGSNAEISIAVNPRLKKEIIITSMQSGGPIGVYTSENGGKSWQQSNFGKGKADPVVTYGVNNTAAIAYLDFDQTMTMYLAKSNDVGKNWHIQELNLDGIAADRPWIKSDNFKRSPYYGNVYLSYFHPENGADIHFVSVDKNNVVSKNKPIHTKPYPYVQNPVMGITKSGTILVCFTVGDADGTRKIVTVNTVDGGKTFSDETVVSDIYMFKEGQQLTDVIGFAPGRLSRLGNSLQLAVDNSKGRFSGRAYLTWTDFVKDDVEEGMNVYLSHSDDHGATWSKPKIVNDDEVPSSHQYYSAIDVNKKGVVCISWYDRRKDPKNDALTDFYFSCSTDGGTTFKKSIKINFETADHSALDKGMTTFGVGEYTTLATTKKEAYLVWADGRENDGNTSIYFARVKLNKL